MKRKHNAPAGETAHQPRMWIDGGDPRQTDMQAIFEQIEQPAQNAPQSRQDAHHVTLPSPPWSECVQCGEPLNALSYYNPLCRRCYIGV